MSRRAQLAAQANSSAEQRGGMSCVPFGGAAASSRHSRAAGPLLLPTQARCAPQLPEAGVTRGQVAPVKPLAAVQMVLAAAAWSLATQLPARQASAARVCAQAPSCVLRPGRSDRSKPQALQMASSATR
jgi:hypothetical protein